MTLKFFAVAPSPKNILLENITVPSEALLNKPVDCVLHGVSGAWWFISAHFTGIARPSATLYAVPVGQVDY